MLPPILWRTTGAEPIPFAGSFYYEAKDYHGHSYTREPNYFEVPYNTATDVGTEDYTLMTWIRPNLGISQSSNLQNLLGNKVGVYDRGIEIQNQYTAVASPRPWMQAYNASYQSSGQTLPNPAQWEQVVHTRAGWWGRLYQQGLQTASRYVDRWGWDCTSTTQENFAFGGRPGGGGTYRFRGHIARTVLWRGVALSAEEIAEMYTTGILPYPELMVGFWNMDEGFTDLTGNHLPAVPMSGGTLGPPNFSTNVPADPPRILGNP